MFKKVVCLSACLLTGGVVLAAPAASPAQAVQKDTAAIDGAIKLFDSGDREGAFLLLKTLENTGDLRILSRLGWCYYSGTGVEENRESACQYFKRSVDDPDGFGVYGMGVCHQLGIGVEEDLAKAEELLKKALAMGNLYAAGDLAMYYANIGNVAEAIRYGKMGYNGKLPPRWRAFSAYMLGCLNNAPEQKIYWWEESANLGYHGALLELIRLYNMGGPVEVNMPKALEYAKKFAERTGDKVPYAGVSYDWAIEKMFLEDWETARKYMLFAADNGDKRAYWYAFQLSSNGKYALMAAESGDERGYAEAGVHLMNSRQANPQSAEEYTKRAIDYYKKAIALQDTNSLNAICNLAATYAEKKTPEDIEKSMELYLEAANWYYPRGFRGAAMIYTIFSQMGKDDAAKKKYALLALENLAAAIYGGDKVAAEYCKIAAPFAEKYKDSAEAKFFEGVKLLFLNPSEADQAAQAAAQNLIKAAADAGCVQAMMVQGMYFTRDNKVAVQYLRQAAAAGVLHAKWVLASNERFAKNIPVSEQMNYLKELIALGNKNSRNLYAQLLAEQGKAAEAIKEYRAAVAEGHAGSMTTLHLQLLQQNDENTMQEAWQLLSQAAEKHDGLAQCLVGLSSLDNPQHLPRFGMHMLMKGVVDGNSMSGYYMHHAAMNYTRGIGVSKSADNAMKIAGIMIKNGNANGFYTMGQLYQNGAFGKADISKARECYQKGAEQGVEACIEALKTLK